MKKYEQIDISGDVGLHISGNTLKELFENAALGISDLSTDISGLKEIKKKRSPLIPTAARTFWSCGSTN
ncbi:MAG TPA: hypothetical protein ENG95_03800 [Nitrospirae bacterium]|nr:hypothetical protein BMS3Abin10_00526 [bacterium BMS3Abin10]GBE37755.1 hypothetical protein BMS3Bbin08_00351 [bacterium BMS3Bbin08]HDH50727.1 hypothetical protein [Nitrospirota bacterium]HDK16943.1 hypothetical protein [Nitrospirota bacterium]HDK82297.1 hypothetical protein [Nitrospirota bacterium]